MQWSVSVYRWTQKVHITSTVSHFKPTMFITTNLKNPAQALAGKLPTNIHKISSHSCINREMLTIIDCHLGPSRIHVQVVS